jgi:flagellar hook assembly protein FlgD
MPIRRCLLILLVLAGFAPPSYGLRFVTFGSSQGDLPSPDPPRVFDTIVRQMGFVRPRPAFWIFLGNAFYGYTADSTELPQRWAEWKQRISRISDFPGYLVIGNQEANITGPIDGAPFFRAAWPNLPKNGPAGYQGTVYSFDASDCHFVVLNTEVYDDFSRVSWDQRAWLEQDLTHTKAAHCFVFGNEEAWPPVVRRQRSLADNPAARDSLWDILYRHGVEAYVCGHLHTYNRDLFGRILPANVSEVAQIVCGTSGASFDDWAGTPFYNYLVWDVEGPRVKVTAYDETGAVRDSFFLFSRTQGQRSKGSASYPIAYEVPMPRPGENAQAHVSLLLRDRFGNLLRVLKDKDENPGPQIYLWNGLDGSGHPVPPGTYSVEFSAGNRSKTYKVIVHGGQTTAVKPALTPVATTSPSRRVTIHYEVPKPPVGQDETRVSLFIVDATGSPLRKLFEGAQVAGKHSISWDGADDKGVPLPSGTYDYELRAGDKTQKNKLELK